MSTLSTTNLKNPSAGGNNIVLATDGATTLTTAKITTLADSAGTNTSTPAEIASGRAKAWVNFNGPVFATIRASYNVSSITDIGVGEYSVNFSAGTFADDNYAFAVTGSSIDGGTVNTVMDVDSSTPPTSTALRILSESSNGNNIDANYACVVAFR